MCFSNRCVRGRLLYNGGFFSNSGLRCSCGLCCSLLLTQHIWNQRHGGLRLRRWQRLLASRLPASVLNLVQERLLVGLERFECPTTLGQLDSALELEVVVEIRIGGIGDLRVVLDHRQDAVTPLQHLVLSTLVHPLRHAVPLVPEPLDLVLDLLPVLLLAQVEVLLLGLPFQRDLLAFLGEYLTQSLRQIVVVLTELRTTWVTLKELINRIHARLATTAKTSVYVRQPERCTEEPERNHLDLELLLRRGTHLRVLRQQVLKKPVVLVDA